MKPKVFLFVASVLLSATPSTADDPTRQQATEVLHKSVKFFREQVSASGGYVYQVTADLSRREGEGKVGNTTAWIEPPGTPAVGLAYLDAYRTCGDTLLLDAARETADALIRGQLQSGGWDNQIEFDPATRKKYAYRTDKPNSKKLRNTTTFDDDKSQSVIRFLMQLDRELKFQDDRLHEATLFALDAVLKSQYACGAWPQQYSEFPAATAGQAIKASLPEQWSREYPGSKYAGFYTLNDNTMGDLIVTLLDAWDVYGDDRYLTAAQQGGDFFLLAQLPDPQPGWAQQYDQAMHPAWARKFEPPAITGGESQGVMQTLLMLYRRTAAKSADAQRYLKPLPKAIEYYQSSLRPDGKLARFYELKTNRPLYLTKDYRLTYSDDDMPTHYAFVVSSKLKRLASELKSIRNTPVEKLWNPPTSRAAKKSSSLAKQVSTVIEQLDQRGAWVEAGKLRYHGDDDPARQVIRSDTFAKNIRTLAHWIAATK